MNLEKLVMLEKYWYKIFKVDFYESVIDFALKNSSKGIEEQDLIDFLNIRGYTIVKEDDLDIVVTYNDLIEQIWKKNGDKLFVNPEKLNEIMLLKSIKNAKNLSFLAIFISIFSIISISSLGAFVLTANSKSSYSFFLQKQVKLLEYINSNLEHLRFNKMVE
ncbi:MAG: hypothetical protein MK033_06550 [Candidatus Caenarcaniphilales bacterium]|nr:hypothetical protein [Candidatus Caenarcaniphilales bacterium]